MKIWCVEDDSSIRDIEVYTLNSTGFEARGFADGAAFRAALETEEPDLVVLDVMLPGESGVELLQFLRGNPATAEIPIIMATAKGMEYDKIQSLDLGADACLAQLGGQGDGRGQVLGHGEDKGVGGGGVQGVVEIALVLQNEEQAGQADGNSNSWELFIGIIFR